MTESASKWLFWAATLPFALAFLVFVVAVLVPLSYIHAPTGLRLVRGLERVRDWYGEMIP